MWHILGRAVTSRAYIDGGGEFGYNDRPEGTYAGCGESRRDRSGP